MTAMLYCKKCGVSIKGRPDFCPLCQGNLSGTPDGCDTFPEIKAKAGRFSLAIRIAAFFSVAAVLICAAVNYSQSGTLIGWWLYVVGGTVSLWLPFGVAMRLRGNVTKSIVFTAALGCVIAFFWDLSTGYRGWSLDIVLPVTCCAAMLVMAIIARILSLHIEQYIYYLIINIIFGIVPLILLFCGVIRFVYPSVACVAASAISLTALLIFEGKALKAEIIRRTHL